MCYDASDLDMQAAEQAFKKANQNKFNLSDEEADQALSTFIADYYRLYPHHCCHDYVIKLAGETIAIEETTDVPPC